MNHQKYPRFRGAYGKACLCLGLGVALLVLGPALARAHKVTVFAWVEGDTVYTESQFSGGRTAKGARIEVYNAAGEKLLEGLTDDEGKFAFKPPRPEDLRIVLIGGTGHRNEWRVSAEEFTDTPSATSAAAEEEPTPQPSAANNAAGSGTLTVSSAEFQTLLDQTLDRKLAPIMHRLVAQDQGPSLSDIIGGIGYIIGLVGLAAYFNSRRKTG
jgi:nickel transport protein